MTLARSGGAEGTTQKRKRHVDVRDENLLNQPKAFEVHRDGGLVLSRKHAHNAHGFYNINF